MQLHSALGAMTPNGAEKYNELQVEVAVQVPHNSELEVRLDYGELDIRDIAACITTVVNAGNVDIYYSQELASGVELYAKVGDVQLVTPEQTLSGQRANLVGARLQWQQAPGNCDLKASVDAGNIVVSLE